MPEVLEGFRARYAEAFDGHLHGGGETGLRDAYELGRTAMLHKLSVLDLAAIHHEVVFDALERLPADRALADAAAASQGFFLELLSTYEMVQRGLAEAHETARLEQQHAEQLRRLAEASVAISAAGTFDEIAALVAEHAVRVLGAEAADVMVDTERRRRIEHASPAPLGADPEGRRVEVPLLRSNGKPLGRLRVQADEGWSPDANDESMLTQLARMAGVALENVELHEQDRLVAETLQRRLLPEALPHLPGVEMAWRYLPGWNESDIGGDWYDAIEVPGGRLAFVVGDVMGKGIRAAADMGQLRVALRAYAVEGHRPADLMERLDRVVEGLDQELATAVYLEYEPAAHRLRYASAGHPPALLIAPDGGVRRLDEGLSPPLGCSFGGRAAEGVAEVVPGAMLVVFTDGLVERRGEDLEVGQRRLEAAVAAADAADLDAFCDALLDDMGAESRGDDIALLVARLGDVGA